jgi:GNAT superfamily N-acetyltransferase
MVTVRAVAADVTLPLRQQVLRPHQSLHELREPDDDTPASTSVAAVDDATGEVVGTGVVSRRPAPWLPDGGGRDGGGPGWQVRAMAVAPGRQGRGIGRAVLDVLLDHVDAHGGGTVWCNARVPARGFYERAGFSPVGEPFELPHIGPHVVMAQRRPPPG